MQLQTYYAHKNMVQVDLGHAKQTFESSSAIGIQTQMNTHSYTHNYHKNMAQVDLGRAKQTIESSSAGDSGGLPPTK